MSLDKLLALRRKITAVQIDGETFHVRTITGGGRQKWIDTQQELCGDNEPNSSQSLRLTLLLVSMTLCDESGALLCSSPDDLHDVDGSVIDQLAEASLAVSGLGAESMEDAAKNLATNQSGGSGSG